MGQMWHVKAGECTYNATCEERDTYKLDGKKRTAK